MCHHSMSNSDGFGYIIILHPRRDESQQDNRAAIWIQRCRHIHTGVWDAYSSSKGEFLVKLQCLQVVSVDLLLPFCSHFWL